MKLSISCKRGDVEVQVDDDDLEKLSKFKWVYEAQSGAVSRCKKKVTYMHRLIMDCPDGMVVDHIDRSRLNNSKSNLRVCTQSQNSKNQSMPKNNTSGYKGVVYDGRPENLKKRWQAQIKSNRKNIKLGRFLTKEEAAMAYNEAAILHFGEFAALNVILANPSHIFAS